MTEIAPLRDEDISYWLGRAIGDENFIDRSKYAGGDLQRDRLVANSYFVHIIEAGRRVIENAETGIRMMLAARFVGQELPLSRPAA